MEEYLRDVYNGDVEKFVKGWMDMDSELKNEE